MRGFVPTPEPVVDAMVNALFGERPPGADDAVLDPGCGPGAFIEGIVRWCGSRRAPIPRIVGIESDPIRAAEARAKFNSIGSVEIRESDFLDGSADTFSHIVGNPPYVGITRLDELEKRRYRERFVTARGRFDLYLLFFEQALRLLRSDGRLVFITPEKFLYVETARPLRRLLAERGVLAINLLPENTFASLVTYPAVTVVEAAGAPGTTLVRARDGAVSRIRFTVDGASVLPQFGGGSSHTAGPTLGQVCRRVSAGVATGADSVFVVPETGTDLAPLSHPTLSGRQLDPASTELRPREFMLVPYDRNGRLLPFQQLGGLGRRLSHPSHKEQLSARTCVRRKPWYAFHETPPLDDILRPKILCKDIAQEPRFWLDDAGTLVPRHSVYYIVPRRPELLRPLLAYLNGPEARAWLLRHCQRAANGFIRLQSSVLKQVPVPSGFAAEVA